MLNDLGRNFKKWLVESLSTHSKKDRL